MATTITRIARKLDDTGPPILFTLVNPDGTRFDPTGYSLQLNFQLKGDTPAKPAEVGAGSFSIVDADEGEVSYSLDAADTDTAGTYRLEIEALNGSDRRTFPQKGYVELLIDQDLGDQ